ncbi:serine hydrolase domain-containing protein [Bacillus vallismortis]|uniref:Beta-lactamase family protein n=2 Tax=Bacillus vallismortis TaxID=72361 RepID=A0AAP3FXM7_BACVA|nr:serine hydrolase domain-containing protein [Bacillus vallismortis]MBG9768391.1 beta-lactamase [Bacillus vallismortis]MCY8317059.1 beta-lactamase family protein [Bacillus vallismortis]MCY8424142.1 beta-lactamase family protein [Bacillus vallismortis]MCY8532898.1 beta-lactamase family protein [Bacillus vallismortis]MEC1269258.1 serine hydrolase [Bacillus vallismortis]
MMRNVWLILCLCILSIQIWGGGQASAQTPADKRIDALIEKQMKESGIPGIAVTVVKGNDVVYEKGFGYAGERHSRPVTASTLFEMGSTSKAFTALGVLKLVHSGAISLNDPVSRYISGFYAVYNGKKTDITIQQLLHHTSGIPFLSIADIKVDSKEDALEKTAKGLKGVELSHKPGSTFEYATINYDVLGYIIEQASGQPYEQYMAEHVFKQVDMSNTYAGRHAGHAGDVSSGFKIGFLKARAYKAPEYRGNTPAGYIITNAEDVSKWLRYQLNHSDGDIGRLIEQSHLPDKSVKAEEPGVYYGAGWSIFEKKGRVKEVFHAGSNPNFSSFIIVSSDDNAAVGVLANMNSAYPEKIARSVIQVITDQSQEQDGSVTDPFQVIDKAAAAMLVLFSLLLIVLLWRIYIFLKGVKSKNVPAQQGTGIKALLWVILLAAGIVAPKLISIFAFNGLPWSMIFIWGPGSLLYLAAVYYMLLLASCIFGLTACFFNHRAARRSETHEM